MNAESIDRQKTAMMAARRTLCSSPEYQAEAIAKHYVSNATAALHLSKLIQSRREFGDSPELDSCIALLLDRIKDNHSADLGIELGWPSELATVSRELA